MLKFNIFNKGRVEHGRCYFYLKRVTLTARNAAQLTKPLPRSEMLPIRKNIFIWSISQVYFTPTAGAHLIGNPHHVQTGKYLRMTQGHWHRNWASGRQRAGTPNHQLYQPPPLAADPKYRILWPAVATKATLLIMLIVLVVIHPYNENKIKVPLFLNSSLFCWK